MGTTNRKRAELDSSHSGWPFACVLVCCLLAACAKKDDNGDRCNAHPTALCSSGPAGAGAGTSAEDTNADTDNGAGSDGADASAAGSGGTDVGNAGTSSVGGSGGASGEGGAGGSAGSAGVVSAPEGSCIVHGTVYDNGASGFIGPDGCNTCSCNDGMLACTRIACPSAPACVVARRLDECCGQWQAVTLLETQSDPCLVAYPGTGVPVQTQEQCTAQKPATCTPEPCVIDTPLSRVAQPIEGMEGQCESADECSTNAECVLATDAKGSCCACPESVPIAFVTPPGCYQPAGGLQAIRIAPGGPACGPCVSVGICGACAEPTPAVCEIRDSASVCK